MKSLKQWLAEYEVSHKNQTNKLIHYLCVPAIFMTVVGFVWSIPFPSDASSPFLNWAAVVIVLSLVFYFKLSIILGLGMAIFSVLCLLFVEWWDASMSMSVVAMSAIVFVVAWVLQFIGHHIEGKKPSFLKDVQFLLIGPAWILCKLLRKMKVQY